MYLSAYHFDGDPTTLTAAHDRLVATLPSLDLHLCVITQRGIVVLDACPSHEQFDAFSRSPEFRAALATAGLPFPGIEPLGDITSAHLAGHPVTG